MLINKSSFQRLPNKYCNKRAIKSIPDFQDHINFLWTYYGGDEFWYRGVSNADYHLIPSIYRESIWDYSFPMEKYIAHSFIHRAKGYIQNSSSIGIWEWYQIMQHHGLPTRLLDWTEGYLIALYFSVRKINRNNTPAVWVLNPNSLNNYSSGLYCIYFTDPKTRDTDDEIVDEYLPTFKKPRELPIAIVPPYVNERMSSQKSCFTVHGKNKQGFEKIYNNNKGFQLAQLIIDPSKAQSIKNELFKMGITEATLFPDLEGLARELRHKFEMEE